MEQNPGKNLLTEFTRFISDDSRGQSFAGCKAQQLKGTAMTKETKLILQVSTELKSLNPLSCHNIYSKDIPLNGRFCNGNLTYLGSWFVSWVDFWVWFPVPPQNN